MADMKLHPGRTVWLFLFAALAACLGSGMASAACYPQLPPAGSPTPVPVNCYIKVQPIDVGTIPSVGSPPVYAPFNTKSQTGNPVAAGVDSTGILNNPTSANPIGFVVNPATGLFPGQSNYDPAQGVDVTQALLRNVGVDLAWLPMNTVVTPGAQFPNNNFTTLNVVPTQIPNGS